MNLPEVFISYARDGESEEIVKQLEAVINNKRFTFIRDKRDLGYQGLITGFMKKIGAGKAVVVVISDKYLKSPYCMFELMEIYRDRDFTDRIFPIVLEDAAIFDPITRLSYLAYWKEKKLALETAIEKFGIEAITVIGEDYKIYHKIFSQFGEVINVLKDVNALTPQMHRESNFRQLHEGLVQRLEDDSGHSRQNDIRKLLKQLSYGSHQYYKELTGINGPYHHLNITEAILAGISQADAGNRESGTRLQTSAKNKHGNELDLDSCLQSAWQQEKSHIILLGDGGMGKTVSLFHFWETILKNSRNTIPVFLRLHEYNSVSESEREGFIAKQIAWHYLGLKENRGEVRNMLWDVIKSEPENGNPSIVLLMDGFNEVTVGSAERRHLLMELQELRQKGKSVQMVLSSRSEMNFTWAEGFQSLKLKPLNNGNVKAYLHSQKIVYPPDQRLRQILQNPMMLTLYANANEIIEHNKNNTLFYFKPSTTTQGELIWNFLEAQKVRLSGRYGNETPEFYYYKFMIRHFIPYLGYEMELSGQYTFDENQLSDLINKACRHFYQKEFIQAYVEYRSYLKDFNLKELDFAEEEERFDKIAKVICFDLRLMKRDKDIYEFLHQNFRDYFAAVHILNELWRDLQTQKTPAILKRRPLAVYIRRFTGELAGEHYQTEDAAFKPTLLMQTLDYIKGNYNKELTGYTVWNILNIWKSTRPHLAGADFSNLNLLGTGLQDAYYYQKVKNKYISSRFDKSLVSEKCFIPQGHSLSITSVAFHPDGKTFISGSWDNTIKAWDLITGECLATFHGHSGFVYCVDFHPDGKTFISGSTDNTIKVWNLLTGECLATFQDHTDYINSVAFHPDGKTFISGSADHTIKAWDLLTEKCLATFQGHSDSVSSVTIHPDGITFVSGSRDHVIKSWNLLTGECMATFYGHKDAVNSIAIHSNGKIFISASADNTVKAWDLLTGECLATFQGHNNSVDSVSFHPESKTFISGSTDNTIKSWDLLTGECLATFQGHSSVIRSLAIHPEGKTFIFGSQDNTIKAWDFISKKYLATFHGHSNCIVSLDFHPDGKTFISGSWDNTIKHWNLLTGECLATFVGHSDSVESLAFHLDGKTFISGSVDGTTKVWDLLTGKCLSTFKGHTLYADIVAFHPDGKTFICGSNYTIKAWDFLTGNCLATFHDRDGSISSVAFHPDGKTFISACADNIKAWDLISGKYLSTFHEHENSVNCVAFHPDGKIFISGSMDNTIRSWDLLTGKCLITFLGHSDSVECLAFHPDGKTFLSGSLDNTIKAWDLLTGECLETIINIPGLLLAGCSFRNLHPDSQLSEEAKNIMRHYGAIFDENDQTRWKEAVHRALNEA